ncbi:clathrin adaptor, mu subunit [Saccharata proteae CBS 121410]|uniref:Clathrin adaptor, mu subunit n=1 Tax=Saccharata proteae CBS 121410 TaxID=1314787 RepID=A0A9P4I272_9PEZI|nr:clathrin adaptor, mu subunit [Saccharata proteae CBS 121410]
MGAVEALYIFDEHNNPILEHVYCARPPPPHILLPLYLAHPAPRPSLIYLPSTNPPTLVHSIVQDRLLFIVPSSVDTEPLLVLEFLHRVADVLEDFLGSPLLASKIEGSYDVVAQVLGEMCDGGIVANTENNALREVVEVPSFVRNLLGGVGLPSSSPALNAAGSGFSMPRPPLKSTLTPPLASGGPGAPSPVPWRRANVRHTSNELYVDLVESLVVTIAPSGKPLAAFANGSIAFTSKVSGVPDLILRLEAPGGISNVVSLPVFHPCVRLARWRERPGELSFVPPDGRFMLAGYEVDLLGSDYLLHPSNLKPSHHANLNLPATVDMKTGLGPAGADFEVRLNLSPRFRSSASSSTSTLSSSAPSRPGGGLGRSGSGFGGTSSSPQLSDITVTIPLPAGVRNLPELRASRGEAQYAPGDAKIEWRISSKDVAALLGLGMGAIATLRCTVVGADGDENDKDALLGSGIEDKSGYDYDEEAETSGYQSSNLVKASINGKKESGTAQLADRDQRSEKRRRANRLMMPSAATISFQAKGWLPSGIKVEGLHLDQKKSRGLGAGVTPYKGVKYLTVSRNGIEVRC